MDVLFSHVIVYEAMESYFSENDDEITMKAGDHVEVISKSMDGWWKIRCVGPGFHWNQLTLCGEVVF